MRARLVAACLAVAASATCADGRAEALPVETAPAAVATARVVIVSVDGLRPDALRHPAVSAPHILGLAGRGAFSWRAQTILPTITLPSHSSMLSGQDVDAHGVDWNDWRPGRGVIRVPTVFSVAHTAGRRTVMVVSKPKMQHLHDAGVDDFVLLPRNDGAVAEAAATRAARPFDLMFVHFSSVDSVGHTTGWMSPAYLQAVTRVDQAVGRVLSALPAGTTVILTADHGGHGLSHGTDLGVDRSIPWIIAGPHVKPGELPAGIRTFDTAATALHVLGLELPPGSAGHVVRAAFLP